MMDWTALDYEKIANAVVILILGLAAGFGWRTGRKSSSVSGPAERAVEVAGALIDSSSARELTAAIEAQTLEMMNARKSQERIAEALGDRLEEHGDRLKEHKDEINKLTMEMARHNR